MSRVLLICGAVLLVGTAAFHSTGFDMAKGWVEGQRGIIVGLLWAMLAVDWLIVAAVWLYAGLRRLPALRWPVVITGFIPAICGTLLLATVDAGHPGGYMLLASAALGWAGAWRLGEDLPRAGTT